MPNAPVIRKVKNSRADFDDEFRYAKNRIIVATFSSNVHRIQQVVDSAVRYKRKVAVIGRSMVNVVNISMELGYLKIPEGVLIDIDESNNYTPDKIVIITTGSQGEPMSALTRMAMSDHKKLILFPETLLLFPQHLFQAMKSWFPEQ